LRPGSRSLSSAYDWISDAVFSRIFRQASLVRHRLSSVCKSGPILNHTTPAQLATQGFR
jgi:hypothetical protein